MILFDYNNFGPFSSEVWGSVSDWVLTLATIITLYFIYRTFQSQLIVQKSQLDLTQIEIDRFLAENRPSFVVTEVYAGSFQKDVDSPNLVFHLKKFGEVDALLFKAIPDKDFTCELLSSNTIKNGDEITVMFFRKEGKPTDLNKFHAFLLYKDRYNTQYRQVLGLIVETNKSIRPTISSVSINDRFSELAWNKEYKDLET